MGDDIERPNNGSASATPETGGPPKTRKAQSKPKKDRPGTGTGTAAAPGKIAPKTEDILSAHSIGVDDAPIIPPLPGADVASIAEDAAAAGSSALIILAIINGMVVSMYGDAANMTDPERAMIEPALTRILARYGTKANEAIQKWSDPVLLALGLISWGSRVMRVRAEIPPVEHVEVTTEKQPAKKPDNNIVATPPAEIFDTIGMVS